MLSDSGVKFITTLIIREMFNTYPSFIGVSLFYDKNKFPPTWLLELDSLR